MALSHDDFTEIKRVLDERYVLQHVCNEKQENVNRKFANDDKRIEIMANGLSTIKRLLWAVTTSSIGVLVVAFFELILR